VLKNAIPNNAFEESAALDQADAGRTGRKRRFSLSLQYSLPTFGNTEIKDHLRRDKRALRTLAKQTERFELEFKLADARDSGIGSVKGPERLSGFTPTRDRSGYRNGHRPCREPG
ncbi:MAG: hypothetical protein QOD93_2811, partial [Acetobacteraceae bacterium]|nr:hypothetical protein [Acetobacteraceae bacterium]